MLGYGVNQDILNSKCAAAVLALRSAFHDVKIIASWLADHPNGETDPLVEEFGYTTDEAYALRLYFETFDGVRVANANTFEVGNKMTGLE